MVAKKPKPERLKPHYQVRDHEAFAHDFLLLVNDHFSPHMGLELPYFMKTFTEPKNLVINQVASRVRTYTTFNSIHIKGIVREICKKAIEKQYGVKINRETEHWGVTSALTDAKNAYAQVLNKLESDEVLSDLKELIKKHKLKE